VRAAFDREIPPPHHFAGNVWEVDEFLGANAGLVVAEIELQSEDQQFDKPDWIGEEVTSDLRYLNSSLIKHPYSAW
jgi:adenylate cyclase